MMMMIETQRLMDVLSVVVMMMMMMMFENASHFEN
jgi:hypothetical protein